MHRQVKLAICNYYIPLVVSLSFPGLAARDVLGASGVIAAGLGVFVLLFLASNVNLKNIYTFLFNAHHANLSNIIFKIKEF